MLKITSKHSKDIKKSDSVFFISSCFLKKTVAIMSTFFHR